MWKITGVDLDDPDLGRGTIAERDDRAEALARGCEAIVDGWVDVWVEGPLGTTYRLIDPAAA